MSDKRVEEIAERIKLLQAKRLIELSSEDISQIYILDLDDSIRSLKRELEFYAKNKAGVCLLER